MSYEDKVIACVDCGAEFTFTADEQQRFAERGFTNEPKRCKTCRDARKAQQGDSGGLFPSAKERPLRLLFPSVALFGRLVAV